MRCLLLMLQIDSGVIRSMKHDELSSLQQYIPLQGDCLALWQFCRRVGPVEFSRKKTELFDKLRLRFKRQSEEVEDDPAVKFEKLSKRNKSNATKEFRKVEFCWYVCSVVDGKEQFVKLKEKDGGGNQNYPQIPKNTTVRDMLIADVIPTFFPNGISPLGMRNEFRIEVRDAAKRIIDEQLSVGELYAARKIGSGKLRL